MESLRENNIDEDTFAEASWLAMSLVLPMTMQAAVDLGVLDIIAKATPKQLSASDIIERLPAKNQEAESMLDRILRLLASHNVISCYLRNSERVYSLSRISRFFVRDEDVISLGASMSLNNDNVFFQSWSHLKDALLEGGVPFDRAHGMHAFEYPKTDSRFNSLFNTAMLNHTTIVMKEIVANYKGFESLKQLVDVGGNQGASLRAIISKYPHIKGINFDLPHIVQDASPHPGIEHVGGDMFERVPQGEAIFMKGILHDWSDRHCIQLLKNCHKSTPKDGKVIVMEAVLPVVPDERAPTKFTHLSDVMMMTQNPGGKERTRDEFMALATASGFRGITYECFPCNFWVMEFFK
ncbi:eugenol O-methyltransferase family protein [Tripterygium wilfordii]|uniref:caffeate O-methyltransferase n=1 Tax=Tripterygium wilfordii TaxID=458696 RepID=A0A7J7BZN5_TRIWF|nr:anthranilate N-methyltransferase-like [Tripterygium wilfordii]KAF5727343.1 eugenol O-methyltransferase family protein [Tripterygium wilfordii]